MLSIIVVVLLVPTAAALADGRDVLADAQDNERVDACYSRRDFNDALSRLRDDQRLYAALRDVIREGLISNVKVAGQPCGSGRIVPHGAVPDDSGSSRTLWAGLIVGVGLVGTGAGLWARRAGRQDG